jgi:hypothetical protein
VKVISNFLGRLFKRGLEYNTVCGYRSAISAYHVPVDGLKVGQHPTLVRLIRGVFNQRPPVRTLAPSWDLETVLRKLRGPPFEPFLDVPLKWASRKAALLVALATASRSSDIAKLGFREPFLREQRSPPGIRLIPRSLRKQDRPGHCFQDLFIPKYTQDRKLDPVRAVLLYLRRVKAIRGACKSLFVTFGGAKRTAPTAQTLAHWIVDCIQETLKSTSPQEVHAHSTRSASTSVALLRGVSLANILKAADWSSGCVFAKHYLKETRDREGEFARAVLDTARQ